MQTVKDPTALAPGVGDDPGGGIEREIRLAQVLFITIGQPQTGQRAAGIYGGAHCR